MAAKMRRNFSGQFTARELEHDTWRLAQPNGVEIFLRGVDGLHATRLSAEPLTELAIEWRSHAAFVTVQSPLGGVSTAASAAWAHEPLPKLYETLPLAQFDAKARRFWRRVFWLVRVPGGRRLLKYVSGAGRKRAQ